MACLASRESHAARACRQGRKRSRAWLWKSPDVSFSRCSRAQRMERRTRKSVAALAGRLPACDPARPRNAGAGFGSEGRRRAAWNQAWAPRLPGMGCDLSAVAGLPWDWRRRRGGNDGAFPSRGAVVRIGTAFPAPLAANMRTGSRWRDGSPCGTATVLRNTSVGRRRTANDGYQREGRAS